jgi:hypothetical protein
VVLEGKSRVFGVRRNANRDVALAYGVLRYPRYPEYLTIGRFGGPKTDPEKTWYPGPQTAPSRHWQAGPGCIPAAQARWEVVETSGPCLPCPVRPVSMRCDGFTQF